MNTVLNKTQLEFLEQIIASFGVVVTYEQIAPFVPVKDEVGKRQFVSRLSQAGWLVRIKKGVYQIADVSTLGTVTLSRYAVAKILVPDSYVSFEVALQFHGLHDQLMQTTTSVSLKQRKSVSVGLMTYQFVKVSENFIFGYERHTFEGQVANIATIEKALIDMIQLHRSAYTIDKVAEVFVENQDQVDFDRMSKYLIRANLTTQRVFGFLLDRLNIKDDMQLLIRTRETQASSKLTATSNEFDTKWRLYFDQRIIDRYVNV